MKTKTNHGAEITIEPKKPIQYTGHVRCLKCKQVHWMHGPCKPTYNNNNPYPMR